MRCGSRQRSTPKSGSDPLNGSSQLLALARLSSQGCRLSRHRNRLGSALHSGPASRPLGTVRFHRFAAARVPLIPPPPPTAAAAAAAAPCPFWQLTLTSDFPQAPAAGEIQTFGSSQSTATFNWVSGTSTMHMVRYSRFAVPPFHETLCFSFGFGVPVSIGKPHFSIHCCCQKHHHTPPPPPTPPPAPPLPRLFHPIPIPLPLSQPHPGVPSHSSPPPSTSSNPSDPCRLRPLPTPSPCPLRQTHLLPPMLELQWRAHDNQGC